MWERLRSIFGKENVDSRKTKERQKAAGTENIKKAFVLGKAWASGETPSPTKLPSKKQVKKEVDGLTTQLQLMTREKHELQDRLMLLTEGTLDNWPYHRLNLFYERLKIQHKQLILNLQTLEGCFSNLHSRLRMEQTHLKKKVDMMKQDNKTVQENWVMLRHQLAEMQQMCKDQEEDTSDHQTPQLDKDLERLEKLLHYLRKQTQLAMSEKLHLEMEVATAHEESLLQKELLLQEPPAELQPQETQN
nr:disks large homolog 5-like [Meriones unguiculatus]